jgi:hypothetical protein
MKRKNFIFPTETRGPCTNLVGNPHKDTFLPYWVCRGPVDPLASLQEEARVECARVHHQIQEDGDHVGYLSQEPKCTPQVSGGST